MPKLRIYPKRGDSFTIQIVRFEFDENEFRLYNAVDDHSQSGFMSMHNIAAIIPEYPDLPDLPPDTPRFEICLRGSTDDDRLSIQAHLIDFQTPPSLIFYQLTEGEVPEPLKNIYVALSEVVVILPGVCFPPP